MLVVDTGLSMQDYEAITESREWGPEGVDTFWQARSVGIAKFTSWELSFSYVNNFVDVFTDYQCGRGGIPDFDFAFGGCEWESDSLTSNEIYLTFVKYPFPGREPKSRDPFDVIVSSLYGEEVVTVTKWGYCAQDSKYCHGPKYDDRRRLDERESAAGSAYGTGTVTAAARQTTPALGIHRSEARAASAHGTGAVTTAARQTAPALGIRRSKVGAATPKPSAKPKPNAKSDLAVVPSKPNVVPTLPNLDEAKEKADRAFKELMSGPVAEAKLTPDTDADADADADGRRLASCSADCLGESCDGWEYLTCSYLESTYSCDCSGCSCIYDVVSTETCYTLLAYDSYGDGWHGGAWTWTDDVGAQTTGMSLAWIR